MATFYLEIERDVVITLGVSLKHKMFKKGFYTCPQKVNPFKEIDTLGTSLLDSMPAQVAYSASRIWLEDEIKVIYVKNRLEHNTVDMQEFTWVKLSAKELSR